MLKFNNNHIFTGYLKQLLASFNLPTYRVYKKEYLDYKNAHGVEDPRIISSEIKTGEIYPDHVFYVNYIKDNAIQRYYDGQWHSTTLHYHYNKKELNQTRSLKITDNIYTSDTHEYLGEYLRFQRDYNQLDLMPLYNCFSNRLCPLIQTTFNVPVYKPQYIDGQFSDAQNYYDTKEVIIDSTDQNYKIYMFPVKLFENYTIAISGQNIEVFCGFYGSYFDDREKLKVIPAITYRHYSQLQFRQPVLYEKLSSENITASEIRTAELAQIERNLKMFIRIPADNNSSIVVLEGDYTAYNKSIFMPAQIWNESADKIAFSETADYNLTEYYYDNLRRLLGVTIANTATVNKDTDGNKIKKQNTRTVTTIIDNYPSAEPGLVEAYDSAQATNVVLPFFNTLLDKHGTELKTIELAKIKNGVISSSLPKEASASCTVVDGLFTLSSELKIFPENGTSPFTERYIQANDADFYHDYRITEATIIPKAGTDSDDETIDTTYQPSLYDKLANAIKEAYYSITISAEILDSIDSEDVSLVLKEVDSVYKLFTIIDGVETELNYSITSEETLVYEKDKDTQVVKIDPATGAPIFEIVVDEETGATDYVPVMETVPGEFLKYNSRVISLPQVPNTTGAFGLKETAESVAEVEELFIATPPSLATGYIAFYNQPVKKLIDGTVELAKPGMLYDFEANSKVRFDRVLLAEIKNALGEPSSVAITGTISELNHTNVNWKLQLIDTESSIRLDLDNSSVITVYYTKRNVTTGKVIELNLLNNKTNEIVQSIELSPTKDNEPAVAKFEVRNGGTYTLQADALGQGIYIYYIEVTNKLLTSNTWESVTNSFVTNFEMQGMETALDENGLPIYDSYGEPMAVLVDYPDIADRTFNPITTLQLLKHNTGTSYPFADRLLEYLLGNVISHLDETSDNVKRAQKVIKANGHTFSLDGAWDGKMRNIIYDYMIHGHPNGEKFTTDVTHDILGYVDKDVEKLYTSWTQVNCLDKDGNPIYELGEDGKPLKRIINQKLVSNDNKVLLDKQNAGRLLLVDGTAEELVYKTKYVPTGTILNADIYSEE